MRSRPCCCCCCWGGGVGVGGASWVGISPSGFWLGWRGRSCCWCSLKSPLELDESAETKREREREISTSFSFSFFLNLRNEAVGREKRREMGWAFEFISFWVFNSHIRVVLCTAVGAVHYGSMYWR